MTAGDSTARGAAASSPAKPGESGPPVPRHPPSVGLLCVGLVYLMTLVFFGWGFLTPDLDRIWTIHHELKIGQLQYPDEDDERLLNDAMRRHPELARALIPEGEIGVLSGHSEGWLGTPTATALRTDRAQTFQKIFVEVRTPPERLPVSVRIQGSGWEHEITAEEHRTLELDLPKINGSSELIRIDVKGKDLLSDPSVLGVRIGFCCGKEGERVP